jgi:regulator of protease activity HflC (stomatin/prohibitin superfamily)
MRTRSADPLARVKRATSARRRAEREYRAALLAAREAGYSLAQVGDAAGITRQGVRKVTVGQPSKRLKQSVR